MGEYTNELVRIHVLLHREEREALEDEAHRQGVSMSEVVRQAVRMLREEADSPRIEDDPIWRLVGSVRFGDPDASQHIDDELYGPLQPVRWQFPPGMSDTTQSSTDCV